MKASELRLGNLIFGVSDRVETVTAIGMDSITSYAGKLVDCKMLAHESECNPIPITEQWLLKFGFKHGATPKYRYIVFRIGATSESYIYCNEVKEGLDCGICIHEYDETYLTTPMGYIKHVHQLQNLYFALTGEDCNPYLE